MVIERASLAAGEIADPMLSDSLPVTVCQPRYTFQGYLTAMYTPLLSRGGLRPVSEQRPSRYLQHVAVRGQRSDSAQGGLAECGEGSPFVSPERGRVSGC